MEHKDVAGKKPFERGQKVICVKSDPWVYFVSGKPVEENNPHPTFGNEYTIEHVGHPIDEDGTVRSELWAITLFEFPHIFGSNKESENNIYNARHFRSL